MGQGFFQIERLKTGIVGFDDLSEGGLPKGRTILISGPAGSGKSLFGAEFLFRGATENGEPGVFVTFEERKNDILAEVSTIGWDFESLLKKGQLTFVDASTVAENQIEVGSYDFGALLMRIRHAVEKVNARRVVIDNLSALFLRYGDQALVRREMFKMISMLREMGVTSIITAERVNDQDMSSRFGVEDFVADGVIYLYNTSTGRDRERQIEIVKLRGARHQTGRYNFLITDAGLVVFPKPVQRIGRSELEERVSTGIPGLDAMTDGGLFRGSTTLLLGASGTGRTVLGMQFLETGARLGERGLLLTFEEGRPQIIADAHSLGWDFERAEKDGILHIVDWHPESKPMEFFLKEIRDLIEKVRPLRAVIDSVTPFVSLVDEQRFRRFMTALNNNLKSSGVTTITSYTGGESMDMESAVAAESDLAVLVDNIIVMKFKESAHGKDREISVTKSRASAHDDTAHKYEITKNGIEVLWTGGSKGGGLFGFRKPPPQ